MPKGESTDPDVMAGTRCQCPHPQLSPGRPGMGRPQPRGRSVAPLRVPAALGARGPCSDPGPGGAPSALTLVLDQGLQLLPQALVPARDVHAQAVVAAGLAVGMAAPLLVGGQEAAPRVRAHVVNCGDTAALGTGRTLPGTAGTARDLRLWERTLQCQLIW